ncbi:integrin alpha-8-like [Sycon ciliatum]|uniref:integrin alpha-8-like n=1 Tax=Sycon ciliatum TaxID=27933 RepID=UPI0031F67A33
MEMSSLVLLFVALLPTTHAFSLDATTATKFSSGAPNGNFGSSVSFHSNGVEKMLLVGAPDESYANAQWNTDMTLNKTGVLYKCSWTASSGSQTCTQLQVDTTAPRVGFVSEIKTNMRLGVSVLSLGPDNTVLVCASRYGMSLPCLPAKTTQFQSGTCFGNANLTLLYNNVGKCVILPSNLQLNGTPHDYAPELVTSVSPELEDFFARVYISSDYQKQIGWGGGNTASMGLTLSARPKDLSKRFPLDVVNFHSPNFLYGRGRVIHTDMSTGVPTNVTQKTFISFPNADAAAGISTAEGNFSGNAIRVAVARPFLSWTTNIYCSSNCGDAMQGDVWIMDKEVGMADFLNANFRSAALAVLRNHQFAEGFGLSMIALDTNNDGISELLVGAPYYMDYSRSNEANAYDFGRVYVYSGRLHAFLQGRSPGLELGFNNDDLNFLKESDLVFAGEPGARFGFAMASVGDVDRDGYSDVAIGAPGETVNGVFGVGAVYLYLGSAIGLERKAAQRIVPTTTASRSFGYSLSYGWDIDSNGYNDIGVGAALSSDAYIYRSRPVISVTLELKSIPALDATNRTCFVPAINAWRACFDIDVCGRYSRPILATRVVLQYTLSVGSEFFEIIVGSTTLSEITSQVTVNNPDTDRCQTQTVFVKTTIPNLCQPANISLTKWNLVDRTSTPADLAPVLIRNHPVLVPIVHNINLVPLCFSCKPDLVTSFPALHLSVVSGEASTAQVALSVQNIGNQPSCSAAVELNLTTAGLVFSAVDEEQWLCSARGLSVLRCQPTAKNRHYGAIGPGGTATIMATVRSPKTPYASNVFSFPVVGSAFSGNIERTSINNPSNRNIDVRRTSTLGISISDELSRAVTLTNNLINPPLPSKTADLPLELSTVFQLRNAGPSATSSTDIAIQYPIEAVKSTELEKTLYYLTRLEASVSNVACNASGLINVKKFDLSAQSSINSTLVSYPVNALTGGSTHTPATAYKECSSTVCQVPIMCIIPPQNKDANTHITMTWSVYSNNVQKLLESNGKVSLAVSARILNTTLPRGYSATFSPEPSSRATEYSLPEEQATASANSGVIIGVVIGCLVLIAIIFVVLYMLGFFKRKKPEEMAQADGAMAWRSAAPDQVTSKAHEATAEDEDDAEI